MTLFSEGWTCVFFFGEEHVYQEQNQKLCDQENLQPPQIKKEHEELHPETSYIKEEQEETRSELLNIKVIQVERHPEPFYIKEEHDELHPEPLNFIEEHDELHLDSLSVKEEHDELDPEPLNIKEEDLCTSPNGQQFVPNQVVNRSSIVKAECEEIFLEDEPKCQLDVTCKRETKLHQKDLPHHYVCKEEEILSGQQHWNQEKPHPPQVKEEEDEGCSGWKTEKALLTKETKTLTLGTTNEEHNHSAQKAKDDLLRTWNSSLSLSRYIYSSSQKGNKTVNAESVTNRRFVRPHACSICGKRYKDKRFMLLHVKTHPGVELGSKTCVQKSDESSTLETPKKPYTAEKPFSCETCSKGFLKKSYLLRHMRTHTDERSYSCEKCSKNFIRKSGWLRHMKSHSSEGPFSCQTCGKSVFKKSSLLLHMRIHTGERPFSCETCGKTFIQKSYLLRHMGTHTDERPFSCETCSKSFIRKSDLQTHMKTHSSCF
ncbi:uncharacterized protein KZ484_013094 [Pholidichthys leucotaenia]